MIKEGVIKSDKIIDITLDEALEDIEMIQLKAGVTDFIITQNVNGKKNSFEIHDLLISNEDQVVVCTDKEGILLKHHCIISAFVKACVNRVRKIFINGKVIGELEFSNGDLITIE
jgi:methyltransferase-like protein